MTHCMTAVLLVANKFRASVVIRVDVIHGVSLSAFRFVDLCNVNSV